MRTPWLSTTLSVVITIVAIVSMTSCNNTNDQTLTPGAKGSAVVEVVLDRLTMSCVFSDDKLMMRRIAYVESADGANPNTFREGYFGGIWQVDQDMFEVTKSPTSIATMAELITKIRVSLGIDWSKVVWEDLLKPLHSALGAIIYLQYNSRSDSKGIPRDIPAQGQFWNKYYRPSGDVDKFIEASLRLEDGCLNNVGADIVFVLDASGSIGTSNFQLIKKFVKDIISGFEVGLDRNRFGVVVYSTSARREFDLNTYSNANDMMKAVDRINYDAGWTYTDLALDLMRTQSFSEQNGARPMYEGHPRVSIVLTDGQSNNPQSTISAAKRVHDADITEFAIGVGSGVYITELDAIASDPVCLHRFLLKDFSEIDALKYAIEKRTCEAPIIISPAQNSTSGRIPPGSEQNCKLKVPTEGATIQMFSLGGTTTFFTSESTYPSPEYYDQKVVSVPGAPGIIFVPNPSSSNVEGQVFCSIKGDNATETNVSVGLNPGDNTACKSSPCRNNASCTNLIEDYRCDCQPGWTGKSCETEIDECLSNPCVNGNCIDQWLRYECLCSPGFTGVNCEIDIDECASRPCIDGYCTDKVNHYICTCKAGYTGINCEIDIDDCAPNPCVHGICTDRINNYICTCDPGYSGRNCEIDIDECQSFPCANGKCRDQVNGYVCDCKNGWQGTNCETEKPRETNRRKRSPVN